MGCSASSENSNSNKIYLIPKIEWQFKNNETMISQTIISLLEENLKRDNYYAGNFRIYGYSKNLDKDTYYFDMFRSLIVGYYRAYEKHCAIEINPDILWLLILKGFILHIKINEEKLKDKIKPFIKRKYLIIEDNKKFEIKQIENEEFKEKFINFSNDLKNNLNSFYNLLDFNFSTTIDTIKIVGYCTMMSEMKTFFDYQSELYACDYPLIKILGTLNDYEVILRKLEKLGEFDLKWWTDEIKEIILNIIETKKGNIDNLFWKNFLYTNGKKEQKICGELDKYDLIEGWFLKFFPYYKNNKRRELKNGMTINDIMNLPPDVITTTLKFINKEKKETNVEIMSGFMGMFAEDDEEDKIRIFKPEIGWIIVEKTEASAKSKRLEHKKKTIKNENNQTTSSIESFGGFLIEKDRNEIILSLTDNNSSSYDGANLSMNKDYSRKNSEIQNKINNINENNKNLKNKIDKTNSYNDKNIEVYTNKRTNSINKNTDLSMSLYLNEPKERKELMKEYENEKKKENEDEEEEEEEEGEEEEEDEEEEEEDEDEDKSNNKKNNVNNNNKNNNKNSKNNSIDKSSSKVNEKNYSNNNNDNEDDSDSEEESEEESD
jgi:hypothetical protein